MNQDYTVIVTLHRKDHKEVEDIRGLKTEDFDNDEDFCTALASKVMEMLTNSREVLEDGDDSN